MGIVFGVFGDMEVMVLLFVSLNYVVLMCGILGVFVDFEFGEFVLMEIGNIVGFFYINVLVGMIGMLIELILLGIVIDMLVVIVELVFVMCVVVGDVVLLLDFDFVVEGEDCVMFFFLVLD